MKNKNYYRTRINQALTYIDEHFASPIQVNDLALAANFSTFHFQRIYKAIQGESPYDTILRRRLEKAVFFLKHYPRKKVSEIAYDCGFTSIENFSRQFKIRFGFAPSTLRKNANLKNSRIHQEARPNSTYPCIGREKESPKNDPKSNFTVKLEHRDKTPIALQRAIFGADGSVVLKAYEELIAWADNNGLPWQGPWRRFGMSIDDPAVTPANHYRYDFALRVDRQVNFEGTIIPSFIPAASYATLHATGSIVIMAQAWDYLYQEWLPNSGFVPLHYPAMEEYLEGPESLGWERFNILCRVPVQLID